MRSRPSHLITSLRILLAITGVAAATNARAQSSGTATVSMTAAVVQPLSVSAIHSLDFGTVFVGGSKTVGPSAATAGQVDIRGQSGALLSVVLTMPTALTLSGGGTGGPLPISNWVYATNLLPSPTTFPAGSTTPVTLALPNTASAHLTLGVGATVNASSSQTPGDYVGTGQVMVSYTDY